MVQSADGIELLADVGVDRRVTGSADVEIRDADGHWHSWEIKVLRHSPSPTEISRALHTLASRGEARGVLFVVGRAGAALQSAATSDRRIGYASIDEGTVLLDGVLHRSGQVRKSNTPASARPSWVRFGALRVFALHDDPLRQSELARRLGVSHVAVAKQLPTLRDTVEQTPEGWRALDRGACWDLFMADYPGPLGLATYWTASTLIDDQLKQLERAQASRLTPFVLSGDHAADFYAPWRRPSRITVYATTPLPLEEHGFVEVPIADASIEVRVPGDPTVLQTSRSVLGIDGTERRYVDPLIAAWDLARAPGGDVAEAVQSLRGRALAEPLWR